MSYPIIDIKRSVPALMVILIGHLATPRIQVAMAVVILLQLAGVLVEVINLQIVITTEISRIIT